MYPIIILFFSAFNIHARHVFLKRLIGTKEEEDAAMNSVTTVLTGFSVALIVCTVLEAASYYIYNRKV